MQLAEKPRILDQLRNKIRIKGLFYSTTSSTLAIWVPQK